MITKTDVQHIAELADIGIVPEELDEFTHQFNDILDYFEILDQVPTQGHPQLEECNIWREDQAGPSLSQEEVLANTPHAEEGFIRAPRVI
jgi:aspartyl-tRNA(Asn)/glutamyl-tRNA(Gln) amidotransferase subunit C